MFLRILNYLSYSCWGISTHTTLDYNSLVQIFQFDFFVKKKKKAFDLYTQLPLGHSSEFISIMYSFIDLRYLFDLLIFPLYSTKNLTWLWKLTITWHFLNFKNTQLTEIWLLLYMDYVSIVHNTYVLILSWQLTEARKEAKEWKWV